jgi:hypothetical protein
VQGVSEAVATGRSRTLRINYYALSAVLVMAAALTLRSEEAGFRAPVLPLSIAYVPLSRIHPLREW